MSRSEMDIFWTSHACVAFGTSHWRCLVGENEGFKSRALNYRLIGDS